MALQIDADHLPALREPGQVGTEHLDLAEAAVKQQQRLARAVDGVVVVHAVDSGMAAPGRLGGCGLHGRLLPALTETMVVAAKAGDTFVLSALADIVFSSPQIDCGAPGRSGRHCSAIALSETEGPTHLAILGGPVLSHA